MSASDRPIVVVVDDEPDVADAYAAQLREQYQVFTAYSGQEALETIDSTVEVVLLDRRMPGLSGDDVLEKIRERDADTRIAMVTAVDPDFDIIEMPFDDYLTKPISRDDLFDTVDRLLTCATYEHQFREYYALTNKYATLKASKSDAELANSEEFQTLREQRDEAREALDETLSTFEEDDFVALFRDIVAEEPKRPTR
jgi:DNA-binding response OmpR family regulator